MDATILLCTPDDVFNSPGFQDPARRGATRPDAETAFVQTCCEAFSEDAEVTTGRLFLIQSYTEVFDGREDGRRVLGVKAYPVEAIDSIIVEPTGDFANGVTLDPRGYALLDGGEDGLIKVRPGFRIFDPGVQNIQVTYTGGLIRAEGAGPSRLKQAAIEQVAYVVKRAPKSHLTGESIQQATATYFRSQPLLDSVAQVLQDLRRVVAWR